MISNFFITRPIFACVISAFIVIAGLAGMRALPVSAYPNIIPPSVTVAAVYPGATAETIAATVAAPLEKEINGVEDMLYMSSVNSGNGTLMITVNFNIGVDADMATVNVNNRIQAAVPRLPEEVRRQGVVVRKASTTFLQIVSIHSPDDSVDMLTLSSYVTLNVVDELRRIPGVGDVQMWGQDYSIRIWMQPDKLAQLGLTPSDVAAAVRQQNSQFAAGQIGVEPVEQNVDFTYAVTAQGRLQEPEEFEQIVVHTTPTGGIVRLKDVARVELGAQTYNNESTLDGQRSVMMALVLAPGANALETGSAVQSRLKELSKDFPPGMAYDIPYDTIQYVKVSIKEVIFTLIEAMVLVFFVVLLFLQNWRATIIPMLAVPVSLIGTFAAMQMFGFSINMLTLFGMVLAIGIVVDDAIVVLENVERIMTTEKLSAPEATVKAMEEVTRPVIAIVLVLTAVFLPVAFLGGLVGEMYRQFAVTISVSVAISGFVALTLHAGVVRAAAQGASRGGEPLPARFQPLVRTRHSPLRDDRAFLHEARRAGGRRFRMHVGGDLRVVPRHSYIARAVGRSRLCVRDRLPAGRRLARSHDTFHSGRVGSGAKSSRRLACGGGVRHGSAHHGVQDQQRHHLVADEALGRA